MATKESHLKNMVLTLFLVTLVASSVLAYVHKITEEPIRESRLRKKTTALRNVLPEFTNSPIEEVKKVTLKNSEYPLQVYPAKRDGQNVGIAIRTYTNKGYSGEFWIMVGFDESGTITKTSVLQHQETPGLGSKMKQKPFKGQFRDIDPAETDLRVKKDGGDIDAITAATISSRAFCDATRRGYKAYKKYKETKD